MVHEQTYQQVDKGECVGHLLHKMEHAVLYEPQQAWRKAEGKTIISDFMSNISFWFAMISFHGLWVQPHYMLQESTYII